MLQYPEKYTLPEILPTIQVANISEKQQTSNAILKGELRSNQEAARMVMCYNEDRGMPNQPHIEALAGLNSSIEKTPNIIFEQTGVRSVQDSLNALIESKIRVGQTVPNHILLTAEQLNSKNPRAESSRDLRKTKFDKSLTNAIESSFMKASDLDNLVNEHGNEDHKLQLKLKKVDEKMTQIRDQINKFQSEPFENHRFALQKEYGMLVALKGVLKSGKPIAKSNNLN